MANNRLNLICTACKATSVGLARLPVGGDWTNAREEQYREAWLNDPREAQMQFATKRPLDEKPPALGEQIAAFINEHRDCCGAADLTETVVLEWENGQAW